MIRKTEHGMYESVVDGKTYEFEKWGAEESLDVLLDIAPIVGGTIGQALGAVLSKEGMDSEISPEMLGQVLDGLMKNMRKDVVKPVIKKLCSERILCEGKKVNFNLHYQDDLLHMFKVAQAALEVQYGNFFSAVQGVAGLRAARVATIPA